MTDTLASHLYMAAAQYEHGDNFKPWADIPRASQAYWNTVAAAAEEFLGQASGEGSVRPTAYPPSDINKAQLEKFGSAPIDPLDPAAMEKVKAQASSPKRRAIKNLQSIVDMFGSDVDIDHNKLHSLIQSVIYNVNQLDD